MLLLPAIKHSCVLLRHTVVNNMPPKRPFAATDDAPAVAVSAAAATTAPAGSPAAEIAAPQIVAAAPPVAGVEAAAPAAAVSPVPAPGHSVALMCSNCQCRPIADAVLCGWDDWCAKCDAMLHAHQNHVADCDRNRRPRPPLDPLEKNGDVCPCGFFAIHNRPLARPGKENLPVRMLVTVPITNTLNIIVCLICETAFKHHRHALRHMRLHHQHYHIHHNGAAVGGVERKL